MSARTARTADRSRLGALVALALALLSAGALDVGCRGRRGNEVVLGMIAARSGARAPWGEDLYRGVEMAVEQQNARGGLNGRRVRLSAFDDGSRDDQVSALATRLIEREGAVVLLGEVSTVSSERLAALAGRRSVPFVAPAATMRDVSRVNDWSFRTALTDGEQAAALARYARNTLQKRRAAIVYRRSSLLHLSIGDAFSRAFRALGGEVVLRDTFADEDTEMVQLVGRVRASGADVLFVPAFAPDAARVGIAARHGRVGATILGNDGWSSPELRRYGAEAVVGSLFTDAFASMSTRPEIEQFVQAFRLRYHAMPGTFAAQGYDAARWILGVASRVPSLEPRSLRDALAGSAMDTGVVGPLSVDNHRTLLRPANILRVEREGFSFVGAQSVQ